MRVDIGGGVRLFVDSVGSALLPTAEAMVLKPTLLCLHGGPGSDHASFRPYFDRFADSHQVLYVDHRGQGRSDGRRDPSGWDLDTWADDVVRLCDALDITHPAVLGLSFGGFVAIHYAARHPQHPSHLVLSGTLARRDTALCASRFAERGGEAAAASYLRVYRDGDTSAEAWADYARLNLPLYNNHPSDFGPRRAWDNHRVLQHFHQDFFNMDLRPDVALIEAPTLVLAGRDDPMTPPECSIEILSLLPEGVGRLEIVEGAGHGTHRDEPDTTEQILRSFLAS
ncbi:MAG: alpha/beta hydrolase [Acidimicrobiia bacterium]|nr:alpha/beta hydrolase [Acidimicrobiia bacterium]